MAIFNSNKAANFNPQELNIINSGTSITGDLKSEGDLRIDGVVKGNIEVKTKLVLGQSSVVEGNVISQNCDISGSIKGNISVSELLTVKSTAKILGDISSIKLIIESGAEFNGRSSMNSAMPFSISEKGNSINPIETKPPVKGEN